MGNLISVETFLDQVKLDSAKRQALLLDQLRTTAKDAGIWSYVKKLGWIGPEDDPNRKHYGPFWYQEALHQGGVGPIGRGSVNLGRVARERWCFYPNRVGKTLSAGADLLEVAMGIHAHIKTALPNTCAVVVDSHSKSRALHRKMIAELLPKDMLAEIEKKSLWHNRYADKPSTLKLPDPYGSEIHFLAYQQEPQEFESYDFWYLWADEEPPFEKYLQWQTRLLSKAGYLLCTMTPWQEEGSAGISWTADAILDNDKQPPEKRKEIWIAPQIRMTDCPLITPKALEEWKKNPMSPEEFKARFEGVHMQRSGKVFKAYRDAFFDATRPQTSGHLLPANFPLNPDWIRALVLDPSSPEGTMAALLLAVATYGWWQGILFHPGDYFFYAEMKEKDLSVPEAANRLRLLIGAEPMDIKLMDGRWINQPAAADRPGLTYGLMFQEHGLYFESWGANEVQVEEASMNAYLLRTLDRSMRGPGMFVSEKCQKLRWEIEHYIHALHSSGALKGSRKYTGRKKQKFIHLVDAAKAACNLKLEPFRRVTSTGTVQRTFDEEQTKTGYW